MNYFFKRIPSPVGELTAIASDTGLAALLWENENPRRVRQMSPQEDPTHPILLETARQLNEYFSGKRSRFDLPLDFIGTDFQKKVWQALLEIPFGETRSYAQIAHQIGHPTAVRAVGAANGKNPISIIAACHRVIGSDGKLTGFAGGLAVKALLLRLEATHIHRETKQAPLITDEKTGDRGNKFGYLV
ncbi:methylated-DNA--[protein]-cysteine S-methyltransferase [Erwinia tasmaniensis]|uniref:methylated-DNA--[protein]-cysteine S-methyltransferase n=1 Tax=Erwinia tasmaniensis TaxID=338565 RepID=UPI003A4E326E